MINTNYLLDLFNSNLPTAKIFNLQEGQILFGKVLDLLNNNHALISLNGNKVLAKVEAPLVKDQKSMFMVTSVGDEVKLKLMTDPDNANHPIQSTNDLLSSFGIKNNQLNNKIALELMKNNIPINKTIVNNMLKVINNGTQLEDAIQATKILRDRNLPISPQNMKAINEFLNDESIASKFTDLEQKINSFLSNDKAANAPEKTVIVLKNVAEQIKQLNQEIAQMYKSIEKEAESSLEDKLPRQALRSTELSIENNQDSGITKNSELINATQRDSKPILKVITHFLEQINLKESKQQITHEQLNTLKENIQALIAHKEVLPKDVQGSLEKAFHHLAGQHFLSSPEENIFSQSIIHFPNFIPNSKKGTYLQIHTKQGKNGEKIDPDHIRFVFLFQFDHLGDTMIDMRVVQHQILLKVHNDHPYSKDIFKGFELAFIDFIKKEGFQTTGISFQGLSKDKSKAVTNTIPYSGVDIKV